jgi:uncharacterized OB-fold protein
MPVPAASADTLPWWQAAAAHRLVVQRCTRCGTVRHPPRPLCPACRSFEHEWSELSGRGTVYTFTVVHQAFVPSLVDQLPYVVAAVELEGGGGARLVTNVVDVEPSQVGVGMAVQVVWEDMGPELSLPRVRPA